MRAPLWLTLCSLITLLGITIFSIRCYKSRPYLLFGWSWYLVTISPYALTLAFYNIDITTRYMYIPSIGLFIMAVWGISDLLSQTVYSKKIIFVLILVFLPVFATASYRQSQKMKEENRYVRHIINSRIHYGAYALAVDPNNTMAHHSLGTAYSRKGKHERAVRHFRKALRINPDDTASLHNLAGVLVEMGKIEEAIRCYYAVLKINPRLYRTHNNLATALAQKREFETAIAHLQKALQINPNYHTARKNLEKILQTKKQARP